MCRSESRETMCFFFQQNEACHIASFIYLLFCLVSAKKSSALRRDSVITAPASNFVPKIWVAYRQIFSASLSEPIVAEVPTQQICPCALSCQIQHAGKRAFKGGIGHGERSLDIVVQPLFQLPDEYERYHAVHLLLTKVFFLTLEICALVWYT